MTRRISMTTVLAAFLLMPLGSAHAAPIHDAARTGDLKMLDSLLSADKTLLEAVNERGFTPIWVAVLRGQPEAVKLLLDRGADMAGSNKAQGSLVDAAFMTECQSRKEPVIAKLLIQRGASFDFNKPSRFGLTPLRMAVALNNPPAARWLIESGADMNLAIPKDGRTALNDAALRNRTEIAQLLIDKGADLNVVDKDGCSPLWYASRAGSTDLAESLLVHGADSKLTDIHYRRTPLHNAALKGYPKITQLLLKAGADPKALDAKERTPLQSAAKHGHRAAAAILQKHSEAAMPKDSEPATGLTDVHMKPAPNSALVWYLNLRGWAVRTSDHLLLFDHEEFEQVRPPEPSLVNGFVVLPEIKELSLIGLYTCFHFDSGEFSYLHALGDSLAKVAFVHNVDDRWRGGRNALYLGPWENRTIDDVQVHSFKTTGPDFMPTLTYLVSVDGLNIVYVGFGTDDIDAYRSALDSIARHAPQIDMAFLPIPDVEKADSSDLRAFVERLRPHTVILLDPDRREYLFPAMAEKIKAWGYKTEVFCAEDPGDHMIYRKDK